MQKKWLLLGVLGVALVINPYLACSSSSEDEFKYTESEMKSAVLGTWQGTAEIDGETVSFSLVLEQQGSKSKTQSAPRVSPQCATRSFVKPAAACITMSEMPLVGTITSQNPDLNGALDGAAHAYVNLDPTEFDLELEAGLSLRGMINGDSLSDGAITAASGNVGTFSLSRP